MEMKFYRCEHCGNIVAMVKESGVPVICCGEAMKPLVPNTVEAAHEKHIPVLSREGERVTVTVGSVAHPMLDNHYIEWIALQTKSGNQRKGLLPSTEWKARTFPRDPIWHPGETTSVAIGQGAITVNAQSTSMRLTRANTTSAITPMLKGSGLITIVVPETSASAWASSSPVGRLW